MQPHLPPQLVRLILNYAYVENNINILLALVKLFINNYYDYDSAKIIVDKLNKIFANYKLKTHFIIVRFSNDCRIADYNTDLNDEFKPRLVIDNGDNITNDVINDLVLHFLLSENAEAAEPTFYPPDDVLEYIERVNSILKHNNFKLRVIPYHDEFAMQKIFKTCS